VSGQLHAPAAMPPGNYAGSPSVGRSVKSRADLDALPLLDIDLIPRSAGP
jgi:hypothetical protein